MQENNASLRAEEDSVSAKERIRAAFAHREGDRVPLFEQSFASDVAASGGGFVLGSPNSIMPGTPAKNVMAMIGTALTYGCYWRKQTDENFLYCDRRHLLCNAGSQTERGMVEQDALFPLG